MQDAETIRKNLVQFTGSERFYRHWTGNAIYTEGAKYLAEAAGCHWLLDLIVTNQTFGKIREEDFQVWKLRVSGTKATLTCEDGDDGVVHTQEIGFTDFPLSEIDVWCLWNDIGRGPIRTLLLPGEY